MNVFRQHLCLLLAVAALAVGHQANAGTTAAPAPAAKAAPKEVALSGKVLETMDGGGYTYILLKKGAEKVWIAAPLMKVSVGQELTLVPGYELRDFTSKALNRKFDRLIFTAGLDSKNVQLSPSAIKMAHEGVPQNGQQQPSETTKVSTAAAPKGSTVKPVVPISIVQVSKAKGSNSYSIAQLYAKKSKLEKKPVVVRGKVIKVTTRIMKRNWIHIKDGSGSEKKKTADLVITTTDLPKEGDVVTARGTLYNNVDFGSGYRYDLIIQGARLSK